eukprot:CAMPEP_0202859410 /NCGR_PEP_ID=MMETSP1391-20130828/1536_1 /ASSEMBLY_ACC=CAM_ASM_000867 /TAXON_ID=1034604 /ORGANISM="Chlamydomonas leiostraca, Strain SAG 11-49" /LENGTH=174 /DNA_ID=CAMNT_0049538443 /DNA_START=285 /DNA_END=810 /DNA_ORIENTATION=-
MSPLHRLYRGLRPWRGGQLKPVLQQLRQLRQRAHDEGGPTLAFQLLQAVPLLALKVDQAGDSTRAVANTMSSLTESPTIMASDAGMPHVAQMCSSASGDGLYANAHSRLMEGWKGATPCATMWCAWKCSTDLMTLRVMRPRGTPAASSMAHSPTAPGMSRMLTSASSSMSAMAL